MKIYEVCKKRENILKYLSTYLITMFPNALFICFQLFRSALTRHKTVKCRHNKKKNRKTIATIIAKNTYLQITMLLGLALSLSSLKRSVTERLNECGIVGNRKIPHYKCQQYVYGLEIICVVIVISSSATLAWGMRNAGIMEWYETWAARGVTLYLLSLSVNLQLTAHY